MLCPPYHTRGRAEERSLHRQCPLSGVLLGNTTANGTALVAFPALPVYFHWDSVKGKAPLETSEERMMVANWKWGYMQPGFIKGELCQKNLISYQRTLIGFPSKGNTAEISGYRQSIWYDATWEIICSEGMMGLGGIMVSVLRSGWGRDEYR